MKALLVNKISDLFLTIGICLTFYIFGSLDFSLVFSLIPYFLNQYLYIIFFKINILNMLAFLLFLGAVGKSAQIGLHT
jgi:NADH-quinone oxidoreductase subunit L